MHDGRTRKMNRPAPPQPELPYHANRRIALVVLRGFASGMEHELDGERYTMGRGTENALHFEDTMMSREHACFERVETGYRVRDLGSTNGVWVNGSEVPVSELKHGDRIEIGNHVFQYVVEDSSPTPKTYDLSAD